LIGFHNAGIKPTLPIPISVSVRFPTNVLCFRLKSFSKLNQLILLLEVLEVFEREQASNVQVIGPYELSQPGKHVFIKIGMNSVGATNERAPATTLHYPFTKLDGCP
jgi:hypothetical protein